MVSGGAFYGGSIYFTEIKNIIIENSIFTHNSAINSGGVIYGTIVSNGISIKNSTFYENKSLKKGGAIYVDKLNAMTIVDSKIFNNIASHSGGFLATRTISDNLSFHSSKLMFN